MRTFIALEISEEIREVLAQIESHLKYAGADVKWVTPGNIHLTLKFLGEVDEGRIEKIKAILDKIGKQTKPFEITIKDIGAFPKIDLPRVIWVGLDKGAAESAELAKRIEDELSKLGFDKEDRPFTAHLTIGRVRSPKNKLALKERMQSLSFELKARSSKIVSSVTLFQSALTPSGSIYTKLHEAALAG